MNEHFASLVLGLAQQAATVLSGDLPPGVDKLDAEPRKVARHLIDTIAMLEEKTRGNLDTAEAELLSRSLTALRIEYSTGTSN